MMLTWHAKGTSIILEIVLAKTVLSTPSRSAFFLPNFIVQQAYCSLIAVTITQFGTIP